MKILLKFSLLNCKTKVDPFPFWACVLSSPIDEEINIDYEYLNRDNVYKMDDCEHIRLRICHHDYSEIKIYDSDKKYKKRPEYFIATDRTFLKGSPYKNSSSLVETYYQDTYDFIRELREFCGYDSEYKLNLLHHNTIKLIKEKIGVNILENESTAGALSVYNKLPAFHVDGNYNSRRGERYITISALEDVSAYEDRVVQIEITDDNKILYNTLQKLFFESKYVLPAELEDFSQIHISIFGKKITSAITGKIYEERFNLVRSINFGISAGGSHSKIVHNRYLNREIDKIAVYDHINDNSNNPKDFFDIERSYRSLIMGQKKEFLESIYFTNKPDGQKAFLDWIRKILHSAKIVKIIDPFFDNYGLDDFLSCCDSNFQLSIVTTDPETRGKSIIISNTENLRMEILRAFPDCKIYYAPKFHDRYLFVDDGREQKLYSFSNSWNGTVNHFSLFVQEVPMIPALRIIEEINTCINDNYLQKPYVAAPPGENNGESKKTHTNVQPEILAGDLKSITADSNNREIINLISGLISANYYSNNKKETTQQEIRECLEKLSVEKIIGIIDIATEMLLLEQKELFDKENEYMDGKPFSWYDTPRKCQERASNLSMWGEIRSYHLSLNDRLAELLVICFELYPKEVIKTLLKHEKNICVKKYVKTNVTILKYSVSEPIIQSFLLDYYPIDGYISEKAWDLIRKCDSCIYIRIFFAVSIIYEALSQDGEYKRDFHDIIENFSGLCLTQNEIAVVLGKTLNNIILRKKSQFYPGADYQDSIISYVTENSDEQGIIEFCFIAFLESFDILANDFIKFLQSLENINRKTVEEKVEKIFLLYALQTNPKLQEKVRSLTGIDKKEIPVYFGREEQEVKEPSGIDIRKFIPFSRFLGRIFADCLEKARDASVFDKLVFSLSTDKSLIFNIKFTDKLVLFYYELFFLLNTVFYMKNKNTGAQKILDFVSWFLPLCIDNLPNDFYGLGLKVINLYMIMIPEDRKEALSKRFTYLPMKALAASTINKQSDKTIDICNTYLEQYDFDAYDRAIQIENLLNIGVSLCIRCTEECNQEVADKILDCVNTINNKIKPLIIETVKPILDYGMKYAKNPSGEDKKEFVDSMKNGFLPYLAENLMENSDVSGI